MSLFAGVYSFKEGLSSHREALTVRFFEAVVWV